ncbi:MAG: sugar transferase [Terriglobia bacterium]
MRSRASLIVRLLPLFDGLATAVLFASTVRHIADFGTAGLVMVLLVVPLWVELFRYFGLYASHRVEAPGLLLRRILTAHLVGLIVIETGLYAANCRQEQVTVLLFTGMSLVLVTAERCLLYFGLRALRRSGFDVRQVCVLGDWAAAQRIASLFSNHPEWGMAVACVGFGSAAERDFTRFASTEPLSCASLAEVLNQEVIDEVLIAVSPEELPAEAGTMQLCEQYGVLARILIQPGRQAVGNRVVESFCGELSVSTESVDRNESALILKRILDIVIGAAVLIPSLPIMAICAILVKISSPGPVFFRQTRVGLHGRRFTLLKFRSMVEGAEALIDSVAYRNSTKGPTFKDRNDGRVTEIGRVLRRFSLDELPQLFMVLKGDMSLVGPRPLPVKESAAIQGAQRRRFAVRPGLTCLWQVNGRSNVEFAEWMQYDLAYVDRWSLWLDAKLMIKTIPAVLSGRGAY